MKPISLRSLPLLFTLALLLPAASTAADGKQDATITLRPTWKAGDRARYQLVSTRTRSTGGTVAMKVTARSELGFEAAAQGARGYVLTMTIGRVEVDTGSAPPDPLLKEMANLAEGIKCELEVSPEGTPQRVRNWEELRALGTKVVDRISSRLEQSSVPPAAAAQIKAQALAGFSSEEALRQMCLRDVSMLFTAYGRAFRVGVPVTQDVMLPNTFGGEAIPARLKLTLVSYDSAKGIARIRMNQDVVSEAYTRIMRKTLTDMAAKMGRPGPTEADIQSLTVSDSSELVIDLRSGWASSASYLRRGGSGEKSQTDERVLTRLP